MLTRTDLRGHLPAPATLRGLLPRAEVDVDAVADQVAPLIEAVRDRGVAAVLEFTERFDRVRPTGIRVPAYALRTALAQLDPAVRAALEESISRVRQAHADQRRTETVTPVVPGGNLPPNHRPSLPALSPGLRVVAPRQVGEMPPCPPRRSYGSTRGRRRFRNGVLMTQDAWPQLAAYPPT